MVLKMSQKQILLSTLQDTFWVFSIFQHLETLLNLEGLPLPTALIPGDSKQFVIKCTFHMQSTINPALKPITSFMDFALWANIPWPQITAGKGTEKQGTILIIQDLVHLFKANSKANFT